MIGHARAGQPDDADLSDSELTWLGARLVYLGLRILRAIVVTSVAVWLSAAQAHVDYSEWQVGVLVFVFAAMNRFYWIAGMVVGWLVVLNLASPEIVAAVAAMRR